MGGLNRSSMYFLNNICVHSVSLLNVNRLTVLLVMRDTFIPLIFEASLVVAMYTTVGNVFPLQLNNTVIF